MDLADIRQAIDGIDTTLLNSFVERMDIATEVAKSKIEMGKAVFDPARERSKLNNLASRAPERYEAQTITLVPNKTGTVRFRNYPKPTLTIDKVDSVTKDPIKGAKFHITYASNNSFTGELNDLGTYFTDENGQIKLTKLRDGWYRVTEVEPAAGYAIKDPATQDCFIQAGTGKVLTFENTPLSALIIKKVDADSGTMLPCALSGRDLRHRRHGHRRIHHLGQRHYRDHRTESRDLYRGGNESPHRL